MLHNKAARVKGIMDKALGPVVEMAQGEGLRRPKAKVSKYSLKFFTRDDSMLSKPESIRASVDREVRRIRVKEKQALVSQNKGFQECQRSVVRSVPVAPQHTKNSHDWILRDDLDDP